MRWALGLIVLLVSCAEKPLTEASWEANGDSGWTSEDRLTLDFDVPDSTSRYDLILKISHSTAYSWENLYIQVGNITPDKDTMMTPVSLELANKKGQWQGDCTSSTCKAEIVLQDHFFFSKPGSYTIWAEPYMRINPVPEIQSVSLGLYPSEK
jgi:gliding motility-associated lipoprotein GldH